MTTPPTPSAKKSPWYARLFEASVTCALFIAFYIPIAWLWFQILPGKDIFLMGDSFLAGLVTGFFSWLLFLSLGMVWFGASSTQDSLFPKNNE